MWEKIKSGTRFSYEVLYAASTEYGVGRVNRMSAAVAYRTIFALAPLLIIAVGVLGAVVGGSVEAQQEIINAIARIAGTEVADALETFVVSAVTFSDTAAVIGILLLLWTVSSLFFEIQNDLNDIFHVPHEQTAGVVEFIKKRGVGYLWALGLGVTVLAVWFLNVAWQLLENLFPENLAGLHRLIGILTPLISVVLLPVLFALLVQTMTAIKVRWRAVWYGAIFTSIGFLLTAFGAGLYFAWEEGTSALTVAGSFFVLLLMAFILSGVFLYGAVVTKVYNDYLEVGAVKPPTVREDEAAKSEVVVADPPEPVPVAAVLGFLGGLFVGWRRRRE